MKTINETNYNSMVNVIDDNEKKLWNLYRKIGSTYKNTFEPLEDMIKLGKLAESLLSVKRALHTLSEE